MRDVLGEQVATTLEEIRSKAMSWQTLDPEERVRRIRQHLEDRAAAIAVAPRDFAERIAAEVPEPETRQDRTTTGGMSPADAPPATQVARQAPPQDPVAQIVDLVSELSESQRAQLLSRMGSLGLLTAKDAPRHAPLAGAAPQVGVGDEAFRILAAGLGVAVFDDAFGPERTQVPLQTIAEALGVKGIRREELTLDRLAIALGSLAAAVRIWAEDNEGEHNPTGLGQTIRAERPQRIMTQPEEQLRMFLAGRISVDKFDEGVRAYFEPYRELSQRFSTFVQRLCGLAAKLDPARIERDSGATRAWPLGDSSKQCWATYVERMAELNRKGFTNEVARTRGWLIREWLL